MKIIIRSETKPFEYRTPLTPEGVAWLMKNTGCEIYVESSPHRIFKDFEYHNAGARVVEPGFWQSSDMDTIVIGLKELADDNSQIRQTHIYFAHAFRNQVGAARVLRRFQEGRGALLDLEYLTDSDGQRIASFGFWAGYIGAALSLMAYLEPTSHPLSYWPNLGAIQNQLDSIVCIKGITHQEVQALSVAITGALGKAGQGARQFFKEQGITPNCFDRGDLETTIDKTRLLSSQIIVHCVGGNSNSNFAITEANLKDAKDLRVISDVTCDYTSRYHMFPFYQQGTDFAQPIRLHNGIKIIAIDHLPSLLPLESSIEFSKRLQDPLRELVSNGLSRSKVWTNTHKCFENALSNYFQMVAP